MNSNTKHSVKAYLYDNVLTDDPNDYLARVSSECTLDTSDICKAATERGGADISSQSMKHAVELFFKEMVYQMCDGYSVNTGYFTAGAQIKGVFNSPKESFSTDKHAVYFLFNQGETLRKELPNIDVKILGVAETGSEIVKVTDVKSGLVNDVITPSRNIKISGSKIKIAGDIAGTGVYFINQTSGDAVAVDTSDIVTNNPSELIIVVPELAAGAYTLELRTQFNGSRFNKEIHSATFEKVLTVK